VIQGSEQGDGQDAAAQQLAWEARWAKPAAAAAFGSALFSIVSFGVRAAAIGEDQADDAREVLLEFDGKQGDVLISLAAQSLSLVLLAAALYYLLRAAMARRPELPRLAAGILLLAPALLVAGGLLDHLAVADVADTFRAGGERTDDRAEDLLGDRGVLGAALGAGGSLCLAIGFVLTAMNAMRVGLITRFMGILGVVVGALVVLPIVPGAQSLLQVFWLGALGALFLGRALGGRGPAWETGEAVPWQPAAPEAAGPETGTDPESGADPDRGPAGERPVKRKRKRKR